MPNLNKQLESLLNRAWLEVQKTHFTSIAENNSVPPVNVILVKEKQRILGHGDFSTNFALVAAGQVKVNACDLANKILVFLQQIISTGDFHWITKIEVAGPGFINFFIDDGTGF